MISRLSGEVVSKGANFAVIDVSGVGYKVFTTKETLEAVGKTGGRAVFWTYMAVREDSMDLYGFADEETLAFFELLLTVSGIGPKSALTILNVAPVKTLRSSIAAGDAAHFTKTTGIGTKKAEKIILELRDKLGVLEGEGGSYKEAEDTIDALVALGYSRRDAQDAMKKVPKNLETTEEKIKSALKELGR